MGKTPAADNLPFLEKLRNNSRCYLYHCSFSLGGGGHNDDGHTEVFC